MSETRPENPIPDFEQITHGEPVRGRRTRPRAAPPVEPTPSGTSEEGGESGRKGGERRPTEPTPRSPGTPPGAPGEGPAVHITVTPPPSAREPRPHLGTDTFSVESGRGSSASTPPRGADVVWKTPGSRPAPPGPPATPETEVWQMLNPPSTFETPPAPARSRGPLTGALAVAAAAACLFLLYRFIVLPRAAPLESAAPADAAAVPAALVPLNPYTTRGLPDPALTPGESGASGGTSAPIPAEVRQAVFAAYGIKPGDGKYVISRLIPSSLKGTDTPANLFPTTPWFVSLKGRLDTYLTEQVAGGKMSLEDAQKALTGNWIDATHRFYLRNYGEEDEAKARATEDQLKWGPKTP